MQEPECTALSTVGFVPLTKGYVAMVDANDLPMLRKVKWSAQRQPYGHVYAMNRKFRGMHRYLMGVPKNVFMDHINGNGLDNRRDNLRVATNSENTRNSRKRIHSGTSKYKGVQNEGANWAARITLDGTSQLIGRYQNEIDAAMAYDACAVAFYGEFACLNIPDWSHSRPRRPMCHQRALQLLQKLQGKSKSEICKEFREEQREKQRRCRIARQEARRRRREQWEADAPTRHHDRKRKYPWMILEVGQSFFVSEDAAVNTLLRYANDRFYPRQFRKVDTPGGWLVKRLDDADGPKLTRFQQACRLLGITNGVE